MIGEFNLYGIYFPGCWCWAWSRWAWPGPRRLLARAGLYRLVWHPALFDLALFVVLLYGVT